MTEHKRGCVARKKLFAGLIRLGNAVEQNKHDCTLWVSEGKEDIGEGKSCVALKETTTNG